MQFFLEAGYKLLQTVEVDAENEKIQKKSVCIQSNIWSSTEKTHKQKAKKKAKKLLQEGKV